MAQSEAGLFHQVLFLHKLLPLIGHSVEKLRLRFLLELYVLLAIELLVFEDIKV